MFYFKLICTCMGALVVAMLLIDLVATACFMHLGLILVCV